MNLAQNISTLRRKNHWSQEEFATRMDVSRQAVSKWESGLSTPDLEKIIRMSKLFHVSMDELIEANLESDEEEVPPLENSSQEFDSSTDDSNLEETWAKLEKSLQQLEQENDTWHTWEKDNPTYHTQTQTFDSSFGSSQSLLKEESQNNWVTLGEAQEYFLWSRKRAALIAAGVFLCILAPTPLFFLIGFFSGHSNVDMIVGGGGVCALLFLVALAVGLFIQEHALNKKWEWLEKEPFECDQEVKNFAYACQKQEEKTHTAFIALGVMFCILSPIPMLLGASFLPEDWVTAMVGILLMLVGVGVYLIVLTNLRHQGCQVLLQEGEYTPLGKKQTKLQESLAGMYWCVVTAIYLGWSFASESWGFTWVIWPMAALAFGAITKLVVRQEK